MILWYNLRYKIEIWQVTAGGWLETFVDIRFAWASICSPQRKESLLEASTKSSNVMYYVKHIGGGCIDILIGEASSGAVQKNK